MAHLTVQGAGARPPTVTINSPSLLRSWLRVEEPAPPDDTSQRLLTVFISVPPQATIGKYRGVILVASNSQPDQLESAQGQGSVILLSSSIPVEVTVTDVARESFQVVSASIVSANASQSWLFGDTLGHIYLQTDIKNEGNAAIAPRRIDIEIMDAKTKSRVKKLSTVEIPAVNPFSESTFISDVSGELPPGNYQAVVSYFDHQIFRPFYAQTVPLTVAPSQDTTFAIMRGILMRHWKRFVAAGLFIFVFGLAGVSQFIGTAKQHPIG